MQYLITTKTGEPFLSNYFDFENHFNKDIGMIVYDLDILEYTTDGIKWNLIEIDHL